MTSTETPGTPANPGDEPTSSTLVVTTVGSDESHYNESNGTFTTTMLSLSQQTIGSTHTNGSSQSTIQNLSDTSGNSGTWTLSTGLETTDSTSDTYHTGDSWQTSSTDDNASTESSTLHSWQQVSSLSSGTYDSNAATQFTKVTPIPNGLHTENFNTTEILSGGTSTTVGNQLYDFVRNADDSTVTMTQGQNTSFSTLGYSFTEDVLVVDDATPMANGHTRTEVHNHSQRDGTRTTNTFGSQNLVVTGTPILADGGGSGGGSGSGSGSGSTSANTSSSGTGGSAAPGMPALGQPLSSRVVVDGVEYLTVGTTHSELHDSQVGTFTTTQDVTVIDDLLPPGVDPFTFLDDFVDGYNNAAPGAPVLSIGGGSGTGTVYAYSRTNSAYSADGDETRLIDQVQDVAFNAAGILSSSSSGSVSTQSSFDFTQTVDVESGHGVMGGPHAHGEGSEAHTSESGTVDALTFYDEDATVADTGQIETHSLAHDDHHTVSTAYTTDVTSASWEFGQEMVSTYHNEGTRDDQQLSEESRHVLLAAGTGLKTTDKGELHEYTTNDQSEYLLRMVMKIGPSAPTSGRTVAQGDWDNGGSDGFGIVYIAENEGFHNRLDTASRDHQTTKTGSGTETVTVNTDDRDRTEHKYDKTILDLDFSLNFGGSSSEHGGIQLHQQQYTIRDHLNHSVYVGGVQTVHDYTETFDSGYTTQLAFGMSAADFEMDLFTTRVAVDHYVTTGTIEGETVTGERHGANITDVVFLLHTADGNFDFQSHSVESFRLDPYEIHHTPTRGFNGQRLSTNRDYQQYHDVYDKTTTTTVTGATDPNQNYDNFAHNRRETSLASTPGVNSGQVSDLLTSDGTHTDSTGSSGYNGTSTADRDLDPNAPLMASDHGLDPIPLGGYNEAMLALGAVQGTSGIALGAATTAWGTGLSSVSGSGSMGTSTPTYVDEGWTPATNPNTGESEQVWYVYTQTGPNADDWVLDYYSAPPNEGGVWLWSESGHGEQAFGAWGQGEGQANTDTNETPADEADKDTPASAEREIPLVDRRSPGEKALDSRHDYEAARRAYDDAVDRLKRGKGGPDAERLLAERDQAEKKLEEARKALSKSLHEQTKWENEHRQELASIAGLQEKAGVLQGLQTEASAIRNQLESGQINDAERASLKARLARLEDTLIPQAEREARTAFRAAVVTARILDPTSHQATTQDFSLYPSLNDLEERSFDSKYYDWIRKSLAGQSSAEPVDERTRLENELAKIRLVIQHATLARHSYGSEELPKFMKDLGWVEGKIVTDDDSGFRAQVYFNTQTKEVVLAFAGTLDEKDVAEDIIQGLGGRARQFFQAALLAASVYGEQGGNLTFTGHSLGGGLASLAALLYKRHADTFNPSGLHFQTALRYGGSLEGANRLIDAYLVNWEALHTAQDWHPAAGRYIGKIGMLMPDTVGRKIYISGNGVFQKDLRHGMDDVLAGLEAIESRLEHQLLMLDDAPYGVWEAGPMILPWEHEREWDVIN